MQAYKEDEAGRGVVVGIGFGYGNVVEQVMYSNQNFVMNDNVKGNIGAMFEQLKRAMVADEVLADASLNQLVSQMIDRLAAAAATGEPGDVLPRTMGRTDVRLVCGMGFPKTLGLVDSIKTNRHIYMSSLNLQSNGCSAAQVITTGRKAICTTILSRVDPRGAVTTLDGRVQNVPPASDSVAVQPPQPGSEPAGVAWQQIQRFGTMTLREQQDFLEEQDEESEETVMESGGGPSRPAQQGVKVEPLSSGLAAGAPVAFHHQLLPFILQPSQPPKPHWAPRGARAGAAYNPNFRGGRATTSTFTARAAAAATAETEEVVRRKYPDPAAAKPYLKVMRPTFDELRRERRKEEERLGDPSGLLWRYWMEGRGKRGGGTEAMGGEEEGEVGDEDEDEEDEEDDEELVPSVVKVEIFPI
ncbi:hypothetical protein BC937DRAFT_89491 [Endogone sp. FLAS-F59071]|nr:hypothetical protein BC937DRAFT_89491 [Endogone sp. FLAS-F59071]|eukprot:RUS22371.1 hypothetical protein BC937DRAFT_89491 [Endogone sp. FLAS-F59071]